MDTYAEKIYKKRGVEWWDFNKKIIKLQLETGCSTLTALEALDKAKGNFQKALTLQSEWSKMGLGRSANER